MPHLKLETDRLQQIPQMAFLPFQKKNVSSSAEAREQKVFPNMQEHYKNLNWLCEQALLAPKNDAVDVITSRLC